MVKLENLIPFLSLTQRRNVHSVYSSRDASVRLIHAGGREELFRSSISASELMNKYPGMLVARPQVFKRPHESILWPAESLAPGQKYYMIPYTTVKKLKRRFRPKSGPVEGQNTRVGDFSEEMPEEKPSESAREGRVSNRESGMRCCMGKKGMGKKKPFVPPIPADRGFRPMGWEPSLTSVHELSS